MKMVHLNTCVKNVLINIINYKDFDDPEYDDNAPDPQYIEGVTDIDSWSIDVDEEDSTPTCDECGYELAEVV